MKTETKPDTSGDLKKGKQKSLAEGYKTKIDNEKIKALVYRDWVGRRDAFDLGSYAKSKSGKANRKTNNEISNPKPGTPDKQTRQKQISKDTLSEADQPRSPLIKSEKSLTILHESFVAETQNKATHAQKGRDPRLPQYRSRKMSYRPNPGIMRTYITSKCSRKDRTACKKTSTMQGMARIMDGADKLTEKQYGLTTDQIAAFKEVFDLFDSNGGGTIDVDELDETLKSVDIHLSPDETSAVLETLDKDGNGEIDFEEFLQLMTNTERFLETVAEQNTEDRQLQPEAKENKERLLFDALTQFMKKSALSSMDEIVGYYQTKYKSFQHQPHVVSHYAAGARLIGLTEKQLAEHFQNLKALNEEYGNSPYAQPLQLVTSRTMLGKPDQALAKNMSKRPNRGKIILKVQLHRHEKEDEGNENDPNVQSENSNQEEATCPRDNNNICSTRVLKGSWVRQRTEHVEVKLPPVHLKKLGEFCRLTADDLPNIRQHVNAAVMAYTLKRRRAQMKENMKQWTGLGLGCITPIKWRNHFKTVFSHYSGIKEQYLHNNQMQRVY